MGLFDNAMRSLGNKADATAAQASNKAMNSAMNAAANGISGAIGKGKNASRSFTFTNLPVTPEELMALPEASLDSAYKTTALTMLALLQYENNADTCFAMLDALRGPEPMTPSAKSFINDRMRGKLYIARSFFQGATPDNSYTPTQPLTITVSENPYSFDTENWATMYVKTSGADSPRPIKLRRKLSTNQWFLNDIQCLSDIVIPKAEDPWA